MYLRIELGKVKRKKKGSAAKRGFGSSAVGAVCTLRNVLCIPDEGFLLALLFYSFPPFYSTFRPINEGRAQRGKKRKRKRRRNCAAGKDKETDRYMGSLPYTFCVSVFRLDIAHTNVELNIH